MARGDGPVMCGVVPATGTSTTMVAHPKGRAYNDPRVPDAGTPLQSP